MAAKKQVHGGFRLGRFKDRMAEATGTTALSYARGRRSFGPFIRIARPANDNRVPILLLFFRGLVMVTLLGLLASVVL